MKDYVPLALFWLTTLSLPAHAQDKSPILLDTDLGSDIDDAFALGLILQSPELEVRGVTTCCSGAADRAWMVCRFLTAVEQGQTPVAYGRGDQPGRKIEGQIQYRRHPAVIFNRTSRPVKESAVEFLYQQLKADKGKVTIVTLGPLTNIAQLLEQHPDCKPWIKQIVISGGVPLFAEDKGPDLNLRLDPQAAQAVFTSGVPVIYIPAKWATDLNLQKSAQDELFQACTPLTFQIQALHQLGGRATPLLADPLVAGILCKNGFLQVKKASLQVQENGQLQETPGKSSGQLMTALDEEKFLAWSLRRLASGKAVLPGKSPNPSKLIVSDNMPNRVHAFEDYETDIEKRWWMSGVAETKNVPQGSNRSCRGVLTQDFDDLMGNTKTMYTAVIFNPVPGPPMGKHPRLRFRYWLKGTDTMRVQIYSLSKGYHRCLTLTGLKQGQWQWGTVDMTDVRRPDGSGGPLSENERIDDIQFYVDPRAEVFIDDIVLYDASVPDEKRPFPKSLAFTGVFDTGKQGREWPGTFVIDKNGYFWRAAQSVPREKKNGNWIRLHLRGPRPVGKKTRLFFRYYLIGDNAIGVKLIGPQGKKTYFRELKNLQTDQWAEVDSQIQGPKSGEYIEEIHLLLPKGATLKVDDLLLYALGS